MRFCEYIRDRRDELNLSRSKAAELMGDVSSETIKS